jgi:hypothetical protein
MDDSSFLVDVVDSNSDCHDDSVVATATHTPLRPDTERLSATTPNGSSSRISPLMREQDADLLESMHYAASQVSQYSPDGTPLLRPQDRSLPMEDIPLLQLFPLSSSTNDFRTKTENTNTNTTLSGNDTKTVVITSRSLPSPWNADSNCSWDDDCDNTNTFLSQRLSFSDQLARQSSGSSIIHKSVRFPDEPESTILIPDLASLGSVPNNLGGTIESSDRRQPDPKEPIAPTSSSTCPKSTLRRLLSGEVRTIAGKEDGDVQSAKYDSAIDGKPLLDSSATCALAPSTSDGERTSSEGERVTRASPVSVAQEASKTKTDQDDGLAERRRRSEAIQFAKAVGEELAMNRNDLRIIEDFEDGVDFDDDDDEAIESKEIMITSSTIGGHCHAHTEDLMMPTAIVHESSSSFPPPSNTVKETPQDYISQDSFKSHDHDVELSNPADTSAPLLGPAHHHRRKSRPIWPFEQHSGTEFSFMQHLSDGTGDRTNFVYKGIQSNPPEITKRGIQRGNYAQLHRKAWLEVSDKYHRYGKNLRLYYRYWERLGFPTNSFFDWLDSKGEAAGSPLPNMEECPRSVLDSDTVLYITNPTITDGYALDIMVDFDGRGRVVDVDCDPVFTGAEGWIFVLRDNVMYGAAKITSISGQSKERFHHSSFFGGKAVASAGIIITDDDGYLTRLYPHSGHYRPGEAHTQRMLLFLHRKGVDLGTFEMDTQQLSHVSREKETKGKDENNKKGMTTGDDDSGKGKGKEEKKAKKVDMLHLEKAVDVACKFSCGTVESMSWSCFGHCLTWRMSHSPW